MSGFIAIFTLVLLVEYVNGDIGLHWFISLYSFLIGAFFSAYPQVRIVNLNRLLYYLALFVLCLSYYLVHYTYIWSNKVAAVILLALHYVNSALFSVLLFEFVKGYRSIVFFEYIGQNSAEIILTQTMALHLFRNNCIYIENIYLYIVLSILAQVLFVILLRPAYKYAKNIFR